jgi:cell wall-associated NlpC family hydrolase
MKASILKAFVFLAACTVPVARANVAPPEQDDNFDNLINNIENPTTAFLSLDFEAATELGEKFVGHQTNTVLAGQIIDYATRYLGKPYRSGAKGPNDFDCSGFTSFIFSNFNISLSPSSSAQYTQGERISTADVQPGDLLFFSGSRGGKSVGHVAMAVSVSDNGTIKFIHASHNGGIRHDVYPDGGYYSQRYLGARRVIQP